MKDADRNSGAGRAMATPRWLVLTMTGAACAGAWWVSGSVVAQSLATPGFTAAQAGEGKAVFERTCASCHGPNLDDGEFAPPLKGSDFRLRFGGKPLDGLLDAVMRMPPTAPNSLGEQASVQLL